MSSHATRNFGPDIGCDLIEWGDRLTPRPLENAVVYAVAIVGLVLARHNIRHSRDYLTTITGRPASIFRVWKHYQRMIVGLARKLRVARGITPPFILADEPSAREFVRLAETGEQAFFGTFHVGDSDLLGCMLAEKFTRQLSMVRLRVGNSRDTERLTRRFGAAVNFLWVDQPEDILLGIKTAVDSGRSIALQCDRVDHVSKTGVFRFLGENRRFPVTIYHLAALFQKPVLFAFSLPGADGSCVIHTSSVFRPDPEATRAEVLRAGALHFQRVLDLLEAALRRDPYQWFNFIPLNPVAPVESATTAAEGPGHDRQTTPPT